jgi:hypothetical protein
MANPLLDQGQAQRTSLDAVASAMNPGVVPPNYQQANHWVFNRRIGQNARVAPALLGMDDVTLDLSYPSNAMIVAMGPTLWDITSPLFRVPSQPNSTLVEDFGPLDVPPAALSSPPWSGGGMSVGDRVGIQPESTFPRNPGFPPPPSSFPPTRPFPEPTAPRDRVPPAGGTPTGGWPTNPPFPKKGTLPL